jgi:hypothetical protein
MTTPDTPESTDPTRGEEVEHDKQRTDPTGGISAKDPSRRAPDPTSPAAQEERPAEEDD